MRREFCLKPSLFSLTVLPANSVQTHRDLGMPNVPTSKRSKSSFKRKKTKQKKTCTLCQSQFCLKPILAQIRTWSPTSTSIGYTDQNVNKLSQLRSLRQSSIQSEPLKDSRIVLGDLHRCIMNHYIPSFKIYFFFLSLFIYTHSKLIHYSIIGGIYNPDE